MCVGVWMCLRVEGIYNRGRGGADPLGPTMARSACYTARTVRTQQDDSSSRNGTDEPGMLDGPDRGPGTDQQEGRQDGRQDRTPGQVCEARRPIDCQTLRPSDPARMLAG